MSNTQILCISTVFHYKVTLYVTFLLLFAPQGGIQFLVRATANLHIVDYLFDNISLSPGQVITNYTFYGKYFGANMTFIASFNLSCTFNFYGDNCSKLCKPSNSTEEGFYTCNSAGNRVCNERFTGNNCTDCAANFTGPYCTQCKPCRIYIPLALYTEVLRYIAFI